MTEIFTAPTIEEAKAKASEKFGVSEDLIVFRCVTQPKKSLFGKIKQEGEWEATYEAPVVETPAAVEETAASVEEKVVTETVEKVVEKQETEQAPAKEPMEIDTIGDPISDEELTENQKIAKDYICSVYRAMGLEVIITCAKTESGICMNVDSETKSGTIIGRRGETLDSIQYLASIIVNRGSEDYCRLLLDSNGYREKRRKTLEQLAEKLARGVLKSGRSTTLEPMNPYERRIIHSKISEIEGVSSKSVGEEPYRKVVISSVNGGNYKGRGDRNRGKRNYNNNKKPEDFQRKNFDSMKTSFERDYKKPKPEDELNSGMYGKLEF